MRLVYLYGIADYDCNYRIVRYAKLNFDKYPPKKLVDEIKCQAIWLKSQDSAIKEIYMIDDRGGLYDDFWHAFKRCTIESNTAFRDMLEREGIKLPI